MKKQTDRYSMTLIEGRAKILAAKSTERERERETERQRDKERQRERQ